MVLRLHENVVTCLFLDSVRPSVCIRTEASCILAWYTADANATVKSAAGTGGSLETTTSTISAGQYVINFVIAPVDDELELSHVASAAGTDGAGASIAVGDLVYGVVSNGTATTRKCTAVTNFITSYSVTAS